MNRLADSGDSMYTANLDAAAFHNRYEIRQPFPSFEEFERPCQKAVTTDSPVFGHHAGV
ncbi:MAG: hypothetical protein KatS3mg105_0623 [Gemmatales bacterium]|nr:MAG: hypothetical protein KatS3mg105_0623 [Gemmatales bacterium]